MAIVACASELKKSTQYEKEEKKKEKKREEC